MVEIPEEKRVALDTQAMPFTRAGEKDKAPVKVYNVTGELAAYVPKPDPRSMNLPWHPVVMRMMENCQDLYLHGEAGCGKDWVVRMFAAKLRLPHLPISLHNKVSFTDLLGKPNLRAGSTGFTEGLLLKFIQQPCIVSFAEPNMVEPGGMAQFHQFLEEGRLMVTDADDGRGRVYERHPECRLVVSANPSNARYGGTFRVNTALADRFHVFDVPPFTKEQIGKVLQSYKLDGKLVNFAMQFYTEGRELITRERMRAELSVRAMVDFAELVSSGVETHTAMEIAACNKALITAGREGKGALEQLWKTICEKAEATDSTGTNPAT